MNQRERNNESARTGRIPEGTQLHHKHLRNPSLAQLGWRIVKTHGEIDAGTAHPAWAEKQMAALQSMADRKLDRLAKRRRSK